MAKNKSEKTTNKEKTAALSSAEQKKAALATAMAKIEKDFGKGSIMKMGEKSDTSGIEVIPTGSLRIDKALGIGGLPKGRIVEIYGPESSGKTTLTLQCIAQAQKAGGTAAFIDAEHALDPYYAEKLGVDTDELLVSQPDNGEQALDIADALIRSGAVDIIVVDSVAALVPKAEIEGDMGDSHVGLQARLMSQALRKIAGAVDQNNCCIIFINQLREKVGLSYGNPEVTTGGKALKFYASVRIDTRTSEKIKEGSETIGNIMKVKIVKNKLAAPFKMCQVKMLYGEGISRSGELLDLGVEMDIIHKSGAYYMVGDKKIQGQANALQYIRENAEVADELEKQIRAHLGDIVQQEITETDSNNAESAEPANFELDDSIEPDEFTDEDMAEVIGDEVV